ncbi:ZIP zinc/iron transport family [Hypoxylon sp. FL1284]|nr:ZIP zinc/iron transport family [Hypoxylon sp. FL1284]
MSILHTALDTALRVRQDGGSPAASPESGFTVTVDCDTGNEFDGRMGVRVSSIFVILAGSLLGAVLPIYLARGTKMKVNGTAFFVAKYFGSGVIIGTAFMHLLSPAFEALNSPCLPDGPIKKYDWAAGICLMTVFVMFTIELVVSRFDFFGHDHGHDDDHSDANAADPSLGVLKNGSQPASAASAEPLQDLESGRDNSSRGSGAGDDSSLGLPKDVSYPPGNEDHLSHQRSHHEERGSGAELASQMTALFILEFGVVFHSIFIGLTLAVAGDEFTVLYIVLAFHQTFEGLGLGSRLATARWPRAKSWMPYALACGYALSTPVAIAVGLGVRASLQPGSPRSMLVNGVFDAVSAGILIYTGLVELLAHEFMFNSYMRDAGLKVQLFALACVALGCGLMAALAEWA